MFISQPDSDSSAAMADPGPLLHRHRRDLKWDDIESFYQDKNNFAMYLVLPIIVFVYGGCAVIYCIARCRRYMRRKKKKRLKKQQVIEEDEPLNGLCTEPTTSSIPSIPVSSARDGAATSTDVNMSMNSSRETPLPWQVPGEGEAAMATAPMSTKHKTSYSNKAYVNEYDTPDPNARPPPPPSYDDMYKPIRPMSKPPPYEEKGMRQRRGSVEEIITLDAQTLPKKDLYNDDRKRRRPDSRAMSRYSGSTESMKNAMDEERERARQLVRGDRPRKEPPVERIDRQRTPDIISHARTQPLKPSYKPSHQDNTAEATLMARQAAQLLRLDQMGRQAGKKQKRLVFVAE